MKDHDWVDSVRAKLDKQTQVLDSFKNVYCRLGRGLHGVGVIAIRDIPNNFSPFKNLNKSKWFYINWDQNEENKKYFDSLDLEIIKMIQDFYLCDQKGFWCPTYSIDAIPIDFYMNHNPNNPNIGVIDDEFYSIREIDKGEELTYDYRYYKSEIVF
jgi:hypothetical protein